MGIKVSWQFSIQSDLKRVHLFMLSNIIIRARDNLLVEMKKIECDRTYILL